MSPRPWGERELESHLSTSLGPHITFVASMRPGRTHMFIQTNFAFLVAEVPFFKSRFILPECQEGPEEGP